jgi:phosphoribosylaminoimidazole-succinocarboxamide synthase
VTSEELPHIYSGKVRDIYDAGDGRLLMVTSDRLSAFDVVMAEPIPDKGRVLTAMSAFWFEQFGGLVGSHLLSTSLADLPASAQKPEWEGRIMLCRRAEMLPIECIVRGYLTGSAWKEYRTSGTMHGQVLPEGLLESSKLPEPVFTPSTKAAEGHDENISFEAAVDLIGADLAGSHLYRVATLKSSEIPFVDHSEFTGPGGVEPPWALWLDQRVSVCLHPVVNRECVHAEAVIRDLLSGFHLDQLDRVRDPAQNPAE